MLTIATWNVNSIRARLPNVTAWLKKKKPDVVLLQELKCETEKFPADDLEALGYHCAVHGQKSWNGVAILSKHKIDDVSRGLPGDKSDEQSRYIEATIKGCRIGCLYLPNGNPIDSEKFPYKLKWMERLKKQAQKLLARDMPVILGGDYNVIPEARDCYDPDGWKDDALFHIDTRKHFRAIMNLGYTDAFRTVSNEDHQYTFWDFRAAGWQRGNGLRIDHFLLSPQAADLMEDCTIDKGPRGEEKASDHTPVLLTLSA